MGPVGLHAAPVVAGHPASGQVDEPPLEPVRPPVDDAQARNVLREVPRADEAGRQLAGGAGAPTLVELRAGPQFHRLYLEPCERPVAQAGSVDLAVVETTDEPPVG